jgi:urease accessory protein
MRLTIRTASRAPQASGPSEDSGDPLAEPATQAIPAMAPASLLRLLSLVSPALPVGSFAYSQGLEQAVASGWVHDEASAERWIVGLATESAARLEVPLLARLCSAWAERDDGAVRTYNDRLWATRATRELRAEETDLGRSLARVLAALGVDQARAWTSDEKATHLCLFALAAAHFEIQPAAAALGYLFSRVEAQVGAAVRLVPLGQTAGQRILATATVALPAAAEYGLSLADDEIGSATVAQSIASSWHQHLYSRLFRS